jgi:LacI family transcriptional regulator
MDCLQNPRKGPISFAMTKASGDTTPTIAEVATAAGVSRATVSRAFSRPSMLSVETVERVHAVAGRLGYAPNSVAQALSTGRNRNIAIVVPDIANPFFPPLIRGAQTRAGQGNFSVFLADSDEDADREDTLISQLAPQTAGFVLASTRLSEDRIKAHSERRPVVLINRDIPRLARVLIDATRGMEAAVDHLAALGHGRIAYISGPLGSWSNQQRRRAIRDATKRRGIELSVIQSRSPTYEAGAEAVEPLCETTVTAAIAFDDLMAQGLMAGLLARGLRVPEQMSVIGCDDVLAERMYPQLTSITGHSGEAGKIAVDILLSNLDMHEARDIRYVIDTELTIRATTSASE